MNKNTFAPTPPMGWNSYDYYDTTVNEAQVKANADYMAAHLKEYGWEYIIVDIQWYAHGAGTKRSQYQYIPYSELEIDSFSRLMPDPERFPSSVDGLGFRPLADYVHSLGLKFGIHIMRGIPRIAAQEHMPVMGTLESAADIADPSSICGWNPDMYGVRNTPSGQAYYDSLIQLYASWGVDYIKCDDICNTNLYVQNFYSGRHEIEMLHKAILKEGRPIVLSLSPGPALIEKAWHYEKHANMWRITDDFWDRWDLLVNMFHRCELWQDHVSAGCYPDCDMLPLGMLGKGFGQERPTNFTFDEQKTMMTLWCLFGSPLMLGAEMPLLDDTTLSLLTNRKVLAMLTPDCRPRQILLETEKEGQKAAIWCAYNEKTGTGYLAFFNLEDAEKPLAVSREELENALQSVGMKNDLPAQPQVSSLWDDTQLLQHPVALLVQSVPAHGCTAFHFSC